MEVRDIKKEEQRQEPVVLTTTDQVEDLSCNQAYLANFFANNALVSISSGFGFTGHPRDMIYQHITSVNLTWLLRYPTLALRQLIMMISLSFIACWFFYTLLTIGKITQGYLSAMVPTSRIYGGSSHHPGTYIVSEPYSIMQIMFCKELINWPCYLQLLRARLSFLREVG